MIVSAGRPMLRDAPRMGISLGSTGRKVLPLSLSKLKGLMDLSDNLARLNRERFRAFEEEPAREATRPAAFAFAGDTYIGLDARSLDAEALEWAEGNLRILSGLYGLLRPLDAIQPYRLEMGSRLKTRRGSNLYDFWGDEIAKALNALAEERGSDVLVNCASQEYFGAVDLKRLKARVVTPVFLEEKNGQAKTVSFFAKQARGAMVASLRSADEGSMTRLLGERRAERFGAAFLDVLKEA